MQMADRVRAVWHERLIVIATDVPVDLDVDLLVTQGELMRAARAAAEGRAGAARARLVAAGRARSERARGNSGESTDEFVIETLLRFRLQLARIHRPAAEPPTGGAPSPARLVHHAAARRGLPPRGRGAPRPARAAAGGRGAARVPAPARAGGPWTDLPALVPDLAPDAPAAAAIKDAEQAGLAALKAEFAHATYRVAGRRGRPGVALWDPPASPTRPRC